MPCYTIIKYNKVTYNFSTFSYLHVVTSCPLQYEFSPQTLCCYGKQLCTIPRDGTYYSYQNR